MSPGQFLSQLAAGRTAPAYLFLGPERYRREQCRRALLDQVQRGGAGDGFVRHDLEETTLAAVLDDARSLSLFAAERLIWVASAEAALPRGQAAASDGPAALDAYLRNPAPATVIVFDSSRYEFDGDDKARSERVRKFFAAVPVLVEFPNFTPAEASRLAQELALEAGLRIGAAETRLLVEITGSSASSIAVEIEKLRLYVGPGRPVATADIALLTPHAEAASVFGLVAALGRKDRSAALELLDTLVRSGEYMPLALSFLATQIRQALAASELGLRSAGQIQGHFSRMGVPMWPSRAEQVCQTAAAFTSGEMRAALVRIAAADKALRDTRPDDRVVMEELILSLT